MTSVSSPPERLFELWGEIKDLLSAQELLHWDQETQMPPRGLEGRSQALSMLAGLHHEKLCATELGDVLEACSELVEEGRGSSQEGLDTQVLAAQVEEARRQVNQATKVPLALAKELAELQSTGLAAWLEARERQDFSSYQPFLERMIELKRQQAEALADGGHLYDALLDEFEPGLTEQELVPLFDQLREALGELVRETVESGHQVDEGAIEGNYPDSGQLALGRHLAEAIGFDFKAGRIDASAHPFCIGISRGDVRLTWRSERNDLRPAVFGILHEAGHGLYEQGLPAEWDRTPLGASVSLGIHESQSRLWENLVGRSRAFWHWALPELHRTFPEARDLTVETLWPALHAVRPSLIRVEADEATYNLHVAIRFDLERKLFAGALEVKDLPLAWDDAYEALLGVRAENPADGVLQDIHWSLGSFGYFPTYTLGTLAASQLFEAAKAELGDLDEAFRQGEFQPLLAWLREKVHLHGCRFKTQELLQRSTGRTLSPDDFLRYIRTTTEEVYGL
ncbi:MAG: carboxypeptidase M32 [Deltaproteobacteria bacterium]|nr:carboxypeptidase M32 [Deltaproteobacteria bacterium]